MNKFLVFFALLIILIFGAFYFIFQLGSQEDPGLNTSLDIQIEQSPTLLNRVAYMCNEAKTINAAFYESPASTATTVGAPSTPNGTVKLELSDGRSFDLLQTISADGARYANPDATFVFWSQGNGALVLEDNQEKSYIGCVLVAPVTLGVDLPAVYASPDGMFSLRLPSLTNANADGYSVNESFKNQLSPDLTISGVKFTIPKAFSLGTNLSADTYISVEHISETQTCSASLFFADKHAAVSIKEGSMMYALATSSSAGAGNRYEEIVYALPGTNPCIAVRYMMHSTVLENYEPGAVEAFNKENLMSEFDHIRRSLVVNQ